MNRSKRGEKLAGEAAKLLEQRGRRGVASALVLLALVLAAGCVLAWQISRMKEQLLQTQLVQSLTTPSEQGRITQILADPQSAALLVEYLDVMADAVQNLEPSGRRIFARFSALLDAAQGAQVQIAGFAWEEQTLWVRCKSGDAQAPGKLLETLGKQPVFEGTELFLVPGEDADEFAICCKFSLSV